MTFEEFQASMRLHGPEFAEVSGVEHNPRTVQYREYAPNGFFIEVRDDNVHSLFLWGDEWSQPKTSLEEMERILFDWARDEGYFEDTKCALPRFGPKQHPTTRSRRRQRLGVGNTSVD